MDRAPVCISTCYGGRSPRLHRTSYDSPSSWTRYARYVSATRYSVRFGSWYANRRLPCHQQITLIGAFLKAYTTYIHHQHYQHGFSNTQFLLSNVTFFLSFSCEFLPFFCLFVLFTFFGSSHFAEPISTRFTHAPGWLIRYLCIMSRSSSSIRRKKLRTSAGLAFSRTFFLYHELSLSCPVAALPERPSLRCVGAAELDVSGSGMSAGPSKGGRNACALMFCETAGAQAFLEDEL